MPRKEFRETDDVDLKVMKVTFFMKYLCKVLLLVICFTLIDIRCPIRSLFHIPCPACGMTRACLSALRFDFVAAFAYHPFFLFAPCILLYAAFYDHVNMKKYDRCIYVIAVLFFITYIVRMYYHIIP